MPSGNACNSVEEVYISSIVTPNMVKLTTCHAVPSNDEYTISITKAVRLNKMPIPCVMEFAISSPLLNVCVPAILITPFGDKAASATEKSC